jgi:hypothetical protein
LHIASRIFELEHIASYDADDSRSTRHPHFACLAFHSPFDR